MTKYGSSINKSQPHITTDQLAKRLRSFNSQIYDLIPLNWLFAVKFDVFCFTDVPKPSGPKPYDHHFNHK